MTKVFIDGSHGTTGLKIKERLLKIPQYKIIEINEKDRKDLSKRIEIANSADITILCLPDDASKEIVPHLTCDVIDTSSAYRVSDEFVYGFAEIGFRKQIKNTKKVTNPGCHATGFLAITNPLVKSGVISKNAVINCTSITGYSGGGKQMIADYESENREDFYKNPRTYALGLEHKHLKEMKKYSGLSKNTVFTPILGDFYSGMAVTVPLVLEGKTKQDVFDILTEFYKNEKLINVYKEHKATENGCLNPAFNSGKDGLDIIITGNDEQILVIALFDNLLKGASGSAIQCLNIKSGNEETLGLNI